MISSLPLFLALAASQSTKKPDIRLAELTPVTQVTKSAVFKMSKEFSIGGVVLRSGILLVPQGDSTPDRSGRLVYSIPRGSTFLRGQFGIPDTDTEGTGNSTLSIFVDGESILEIKAISGQKPIKFDATIKGAKSIMLAITGTAAIGDSTFSTATLPIGSSVKPTTNPPTQDTTSKPPVDMSRVNLTSPENGETKVDSVTFKWDAVPEAVAYGVEIVMITNSDTRKTPSRYLRAFSAKSENFEWNFSEDVLSGEYQVSVIAFGKRGVLTKFSNSRRFKVVRK